MAKMSSSSGEEAAMLAHYYANKKKKLQRRWWVHPLNAKRLQHGCFSILQDLEDEEKFRSIYRMSRASFGVLLSSVGPRIQRQDTRQRPAIPAQEKLLICLRYLATGSSFRSTSLQFLRGERTVSAIVKEVTEVIWETLQPQYMPVPEKQNWLSIASRFLSLWNIPNCLGAIDGKHIRIKKPEQSGSWYINYKGFFSIVLMAVADADGLFVAIDVGDYWRNSDGIVFSNSNLGKNIKQDLLPFPEDAKFPGSNIVQPYFFVGDEAFPLSKRVMRPFPGRNLPEEKRVFNYRLSRARKIVECAFGMLSSKFRCFDTPLSCEISSIDSIVKCACVLHNFIRKREGVIGKGNYSNETKSFNCVSGLNRQLTNAGKEQREHLKEYFLNNPISPQSWICQ